MAYSVGEVPFHGVRPVNNKIGGTPDRWHRMGKAAEYVGMGVCTYQAVQAARATLEPMIAGFRAAAVFL